MNVRLVASMSLYAGDIMISRFYVCSKSPLARAMIVMLALASTHAAAQTTSLSDGPLEIQGRQSVILKDGSACSLSDLFRREQAGESVFSLIGSRADKSLYDGYATERRQEALAQQKERNRQLNEALAELQAVEAAWQQSIDPKCAADDLSPKALALRKEQAAVIERALRNPLSTGKLSSDTVATLRDIADKYRNGQSPRRMSPTVYAKFKQDNGWGETKCASEAH